MLAYRFHRVLAEDHYMPVSKQKKAVACDKVALSGGVFQNRLLLELTDDGLTEKGFEVLQHQLIPPNDGGIALGQAAYGMDNFTKIGRLKMMCVGLSAKVVKISDGTAVIDAGGAKREVLPASGRSGAGRLCNGSCRCCNCKDHR